MSSGIRSKILGHQRQLRELEELHKQGRLPHLFLFVGPSGVGKKLVAKALGQMLVCEKKSACGVCGSCVRILKDESESLLVVSPQGASIKVEQARQLAEFCQLANPGVARLVIVDEVEKMNPQAANALLKLFEEPPPETYFVLLAPTPSAVLPTVRSRAQVMRFGALDLESLKKVYPDAPDWILQSSAGRLDRIESLQDEEYLELRAQAKRLIELARTDSRGEVVEALKKISPNREKARWLVKFWQEFCRDAWFSDLKINHSIHGDELQSLRNLMVPGAGGFPILVEKIQSLDRRLKANADIQLSLENFLGELRA